MGFAILLRDKNRSSAISRFYANFLEAMASPKHRLLISSGSWDRNLGVTLKPSIPHLAIYKAIALAGFYGGVGSDLGNRFKNKWKSFHSFNKAFLSLKKGLADSTKKPPKCSIFARRDLPWHAKFTVVYDENEKAVAALIGSSNATKRNLGDYKWINGECDVFVWCSGLLSVNSLFAASADISAYACEQGDASDSLSEFTALRAELNSYKKAELWAAYPELQKLAKEVPESCRPDAWSITQQHAFMRVFYHIKTK